MNIENQMRAHRRNVMISESALALKVADEASAYAVALIHDDGRMLERTLYAEFRMLRAIAKLTDENSVMDRLEDIMSELRIDYDGNPDTDRERDCDAYWRDSHHAIEAGMGQ